MGHNDNHSDKHSHEHHSNDRHKYHDNHRENSISNHLKKQRQRTSAIALGVLIAVAFGLIGLEAINKEKLPIENQSIKGSKSLLILSQERERDGAGLIANLTGGRLGDNINDADALSESSKIQANKIKALKRQLVDANQKLHEVKGHLFTKGDPTDRSRLAEICQDLVEKERQSNEYKEKVDKLEKEREEAYQKINRMEHTIDALAAMTDSQRSSKEQALLNFQDQMDQLQNLAKAERDELTTTIAELEQAQLELKNSLSKKLDVINNLEKEITWQYNILSEKDNEIKAVSQLYNKVEGTMNKQLQDLIVAMELEILKNHNLATEADIAHTRHHAQLQYSRQLEDHIAQADEKAKQMYTQFTDNSHALIREYNDFQGLLDVYATCHNKLANRNKKLAGLVSIEKNKAKKLHLELSDAISKNDTQQQCNLCLEQELAKQSQLAVALNEKLETEQHLRNQKNEDLELLTYSHASLRDQLNERISQLNASLLEEQLNLRERDAMLTDLAINLELEKTRSQELSHMLKTSVVEARNEQERNKNLEEELTSKTEILAALEGRLQDKQTEISDLTKQVDNIFSQHTQEQIKTQELHKALVTALKENENNLAELRELTQTLDGNTDTVALLQDRLSQKNNTIDLLQDSVTKVEDELEEARSLNEELQRSLANVLAHRDAELERTQNMENELQTNAKKLVLLQDNLADKHHEIRTLLDQLQALNKDIDQERDRSKSLQHNLEITLAKHDNEFRTARGMESSLKDNEQQIQSLLDQLDLMASKFNAEQQRARDLEHSLVSTLSKHDSALHRSQDLEHSLWENNRKITSLQATLQEQEQVIDQLQQKMSEMNDDFKMEQNRGLAYKQSTEKETMLRFELERSLNEAQNTIDELKSAISSKDNDNQALQNKLLALAAELNQEINRSIELHNSMEEGSADNESLQRQTRKLEQQLRELSEQIRNKEDSLSNESQEKDQVLRENDQLKHELGLLQKDKIDIEQKYINQLNLVLRQQELVNQLSNELTAHKQLSRQREFESAQSD